MNASGKRAGYDVIYLAGCAANQIEPDLTRVEKMNPEEVYQMSRFCSLSALAYHALEPVLPSLRWDSEIARRWREAHDRAFLREVRFGMEREKVYAFLDGEKIRYMPLKGIVLRDFYPEPYLREMVDNDILFDADFQKQVYRWFTEQGYTADVYRVGDHDCYIKNPIYNFEMHTSLFGYFPEIQWEEYNKSVSERMIPDEDGGCRCHFSDEDFYVYLILHWYKHYERYGIGIRSLLDCYLYRKSMGDGLNQSYIQAELARFGASEYEEQVRLLSSKLFADPKGFRPENLKEEENTILEDYLRSGSYGSIESQVIKGIASAQTENKSIGRAKLRYLRKRLFPGAEFMAEYSPVFAKHRWLIPAGYVYRMVRGFRRRRRELRYEIKIIRKM